jgi:hypothetical protein
MSWLRKLFEQEKQEIIPEPVREIIHIPYETFVLKARTQNPNFNNVIDPNYVVNQLKSQLAMELLEQIVNQDLIEFNQIQDFGQNIVEAQILISIKK